MVSVIAELASQAIPVLYTKINFETDKISELPKRNLLKAITISKATDVQILRWTMIYTYFWIQYLLTLDDNSLTFFLLKC